MVGTATRLRETKFFNNMCQSALEEFPQQMKGNAGCEVFKRALNTNDQNEFCDLNSTPPPLTDAEFNRAYAQFINQYLQLKTNTDNEWRANNPFLATLLESGERGIMVTE